MNNIIKSLSSYFQNKNVLIMGFGREGKSTYNFLKKYAEIATISVTDVNHCEIDEKFYINDSYLENIKDFDIIMKSPGIALKDINIKNFSGEVTSQTELMLKFNRKNIIGITGTKGKSTTSSLIYSIIKEAGRDVKLVGNIGVPPFECLEDITEKTILVCEMSSHQLEHSRYSPHISTVLNLFEEHLDHYNSFEDYKLAKVNIFRWQDEEDYFVYDISNKVISKYVEKFSKAQKVDCNIDWVEQGNLIGQHNLYNVKVAVSIAKILKIDQSIISKAIKDFKALEHRLEYVGKIHEVDYYNDSISTIPEATISAIKALKLVDTVILGGLDRGIDYKGLVNFLEDSEVKNIICLYSTGEKIFKLLNREGKFFVKDLEEAVKLAKAITEHGKICLLSPAAASYGYFKNFEERGNEFKRLVKCND